MNSEDRKYELIIKSAISILISFVLVAILLLAILVIFNTKVSLNKVWNICFLVPAFVTLFASLIQIIICFWNVGKVNDIESTNHRKTGVIFSACITYMVFLGICFSYFLMSLILFS